MRTGAITVNYLLSDHPSFHSGQALGSNAVAADTIGIRLSEVRYKPWGEDRYNYNTSPTSYRYTGQRQEAAPEYRRRNGRLWIVGGMLGGWRAGGIIDSCGARFGVRYVMSASHHNLQLATIIASI
jgi:hypothetical protein